jgi:hypothetical protein
MPGNRFFGGYIVTRGASGGRGGANELPSMSVIAMLRQLSLRPRQISGFH